MSFNRGGLLTFGIMPIGVELSQVGGQREQKLVPC